MLSGWTGGERCLGKRGEVVRLVVAVVRGGGGDSASNGRVIERDCSLQGQLARGTSRIKQHKRSSPRGGAGAQVLVKWSMASYGELIRIGHHCDVGSHRQ